MAEALDSARKFLESLHRFDLSTLLSVCSVAITQVDDEVLFESRWHTVGEKDEAVVFAPGPVDAGLRALPPADRKRIGEAISVGYESNSTFEDIRVESTRKAAITGAVAILAELMVHRDMMISVAAGGNVRIQDVNDYYIAREIRLREMLPADAKYTNPHDDLWSWYHYWSANFGRWAERRQYINQMFAPAITTMSKRSNYTSPPRDCTGWERVDRALTKARAQFELASAEEDYQAIGLLCREVIISVAQAVFDPAIHETTDGVEASKTDANRMLEAYIAHVFPGESFKEVRAHHRASLALALNLQHRRTATQQLAALCIEATASTVAVVAIIARPI